MFRKPTFNSLCDPFGSPYRGQKPSLPLKKEFFLPLRLSCKESSTFLTKPLFPQEREDVTALLGARNRYALRLADQSGLRHIVRDGTAWDNIDYLPLKLQYKIIRL